MARKVNHTGISSGFYGLVFIGAALYYLQHAANFGDGLLGLIKALVWPAVIMYHILTLLHA